MKCIPEAEFKKITLWWNLVTFEDLGYITPHFQFLKEQWGLV